VKRITPGISMTIIRRARSMPRPRRKAEDAPLFRPTSLEIGVGASLSAVTERCGIARIRFRYDRKWSYKLSILY
jgi:hypothetical protein